MFVPFILETTFKPLTLQTIRNKLRSKTVRFLYEVIKPQISVMMKCQWLIVTVLVISVKAAPFTQMSEQMQAMNLLPMSEIQAMNQVIRNQQEQSMLNQIAQQSMEQWILQDQYNLQHQLMMQQLQMLHNNDGPGRVPMLFNLPSQPLILLMPNTMTKTSNRIESLNENHLPKLKLRIGDEDTVVINAENEPNNIPEMGIIPRRVVVLPNGQRLFIGSIISAIPFLPFEVNVPDTIAWIYNGISGIIGGIGQRLPFRPKPTTEKPMQTQETMTSPQESMTPDQGDVTQEIPTDSRLHLIQKLMTRKQSVGMPIIMLPLTQAMPIQVPIQV